MMGIAKELDYKENHNEITYDDVKPITLPCLEDCRLPYGGCPFKGQF